MRGPVKGSLLENLLQGSKILEVERGKPQSTCLVRLGEGPQWKWVGGETLPTFLRSSLSSTDWQGHHQLVSESGEERGRGWKIS
jgi:hypothetical protein